MQVQVVHAGVDLTDMSMGTTNYTGERIQRCTRCLDPQKIILDRTSVHLSLCIWASHRYRYLCPVHLLIY